MTEQLEPPEDLFPDTDRGGALVPPNDLRAEQAVLGAMMLSTDAIADVSEVVRPNDFYRPQHEVIYNAAQALYGIGEPVDVVTVADELRRTGMLKRAVGTAELHDLVASVPIAANASYYARIVAESAALRRLIEAGTRVVQLGYAGGDVTDIQAAAVGEVMTAVEDRQATEYAVLGDVVEPALDEIEAAAGHAGQITGVPTGFADVDSILHGLHPGQMITVAARPAIGKSTLAIDIGRNAAIGCAVPTIVFSLEMSRLELGTRVISAEARVQLQHLRSGLLRDEDWTRISEVMPRLSDAPLFIDDTANATVAEIRAKCRRVQRSHGLGLVIIDYLQLMSSGRRVESRQAEVSEFARAIKLLAKELHVPVVVLSQLNRGPEQRTDKRPLMSDLRESGSIEQDSDVVILLHRPEAYDKETDRVGEADLIIAKQRNGPTGEVAVAFQGHYSRFVDLAPAF